MKRAAVLAAFLAVASPVLAAAFQFTGTVVNQDGQPVVGATVRTWNIASPTMVHEGKTDKKGSFYIPGLLYEEQNRGWLITASAEGLLPTKAKVVGRKSDKTIFVDFNKNLSPGNENVPVNCVAFAEIRVDFTLAPPVVVTPTDELNVPVAAGAGADDPLVQARQKVQEGDFDAAADLAQKAIEAKPDDVQRKEFLARVLIKADRSGEAIIQANKIAAASPDRVEPHLILSDAFVAKRQYDKALGALENARKIAPDDVHVLERIAYVAAEAGKPEVAIEANQKIVAAHPEDKNAWVGLGELYSRTGQTAKAEEAFRKVVDLDPANAYRTFYNIAVSIGNRADLTDADNRKIVESLKRSIELKADFAPSHKQLAYALLRTGDVAGAKAELEQYLKTDPKASDAAEVRDTIKSLGSMKPAKK